MFLAYTFSLSTKKKKKNSAKFGSRSGPVSKSPLRFGARLVGFAWL